MKFYHGILTLCIIGVYTQSSNAFVVTSSSSLAKSSSSSSSSLVNNNYARARQTKMSASAEDSAKAFTDYMAKSHEEKLKALKDLEDKKNVEIETLKEEMASMKSGSGGGELVQAQPPAPIVDGSIEDLSSKLLAYQNFMAEYIVKAQEDKSRAVKEAEASVAKKYEDKLNALMLPEAATSASVTTKSEESKLYEDRNGNIAAAAKAGKSRWGNKELQKVAGITVESTMTSPAAPPEITASQEETIAAADHGLRADGGVGGLTLAERIVSGAEANSNGVAVSSSSPVYDLRNAHISEAAKAGKQSRWGTMEENKAIEMASNALPAAANGHTVTVTPEIDAADHGLRADGGVGGPSLAERVNLGAQLLQ